MERLANYNITLDNNKIFLCERYSTKYIYGTSSYKYLIVSNIEEYDKSVLSDINKIYLKIADLYAISDRYARGKIMYANYCGPNSGVICKNIKSDIIIDKKIIVIQSFNNTYEDNKKQMIDIFFGNSIQQIGMSYHALAYLEFVNNNEKYYIAIETTKNRPYTLQFFVSNTYEDLKELIKTIYCCPDFEINTYTDDYIFMNHSI
jgi:hypothetical protein